MDMEAKIPFINASEYGSLQFVNNVDGYRQFSGPANLAGKRVISNEKGGELYQHQDPLFPESPDWKEITVLTYQRKAAR
jgi:hypothetical protein